MAEESDLERTEQASPRRLEQAHEDGQVARSVELSTFAVVLASAGALWFGGASLARELQSLVRGSLSFDRELAFDTGGLLAQFHAQTVQALLAFLPIGLVVFIAALCAPMLLSGWLFSSKALTPDLERLDPLSGLRRMFSMRSVVELLKSLAKAGLLVAGGIWTAWLFKEDVMRLPMLPVSQALEQSTSLIGLSFLALLGVMLVIVAIDVPYQLWSFHRKLRMTREEVRREMKETEGDPQVKARVRSVQRDIARRRMMAQVPKADVVVTNPTRYAVALRYRGEEMRAPQVVAKGMNLIAARIKELAEEHRIPVVEAAPLARALHRHAVLDREIPAALFAAVAEVLAYVYQLTRWQARGGVAPALPAELTIPKALDPEAKSA